MMSEELQKYCFQLISDIPYEVCVTMLIVLCVGALVLIGLYGFKKGLFYSLRLLLVEYVFLLYASTVIFRPVMSDRKYDFTPLWSYRAYFEGRESNALIENFANMFVFVPVGLLFGFMVHGLKLTVRKGWLIALSVGLGLSVGIEFLQFVYKKGFSELDDIMHNTLGCLIGFVIWLVLKKIGHCSLNCCKSR